VVNHVNYTIAKTHAKYRAVIKIICSIPEKTNFLEKNQEVSFSYTLSGNSMSAEKTIRMIKFSLLVFHLSSFCRKFDLLTQQAAHTCYELFCSTHRNRLPANTRACDVGIQFSH